jgi:hypothetical protein
MGTLSEADRLWSQFATSYVEKTEVLTPQDQR